MNRWFNSFINRKFTSNEVQAILILFAKGKVLITGDVRTNITELRKNVLRKLPRGKINYSKKTRNH